VTTFSPHFRLKSTAYKELTKKSAGTSDKKTLVNTHGTVANPITVNGAGGIDRVYLLGRQDQYIISAEKSGVVTLAESSGLDQNTSLSGISVIEFADGTTFVPPTDIYNEPSISGGIAALAGVGGLGLLAWVLF
jgi:hypothetical protein